VLVTEVARPRKCHSLLGGAQVNPSLPHCVQTSFGTHTVYSVGSTAGSFLVWGDKAVEVWRWQFTSI